MYVIPLRRSIECIKYANIEIRCNNKSRYTY